jgi:Undecaprenyl-phosphate glucose phosphotransferase
MGKRGIMREFATELDALYRVLDLLAVWLGGMVAHYIVFGQGVLAPRYTEAFIFALILSFIIFRWFSLYKSWRGVSVTSELQTVFFAWCSVFLSLTFLAFLLKTGNYYSRMWAGTWFVSTTALLFASRLGIRTALRFMRANGFNYRRIVIVGASPVAAYVIRQLNDLPWTGFKIAGLIDEKSDVPHVGVFQGVPVLGGLENLVPTLRDHDIDQVWICLPLRAEEQVQQVMDILQFSTVDIRYIPDISGFRLLNHSISEVAGLPVLNLSTTPLEGWNRVVKAVEDRILALIILLLISPVMLAIAIGVKLSSPGPIFFRQLRHGWDGKPIEVWKFRSMKIHAENHGTVTQATKGDPRITKFGAFLRKTSLDELPQFINVLQGRMSIVGPRPHAIAHNELYKHQVERYMQRHKVKPGITGWAQVNGYRGETDTLDKMEKRVEYDLYYIEHWSVWMDIKIILMTILVGFRHRNAY